MSNKKGFTLTEILLAVMIVGIIGVALAALTTAALRESGVGRVRIMLRNQISLFLRQLRQDVRSAKSVSLLGSSIMTLEKMALEPNGVVTTVVYSCETGVCKRGTETVLNHVQTGSSGGWSYPQFTILTNGGRDEVKSVLRVRLVVGMNSDPVIKEAVEETILLPNGLAIKQEE